MHQSRHRLRRPNRQWGCMTGGLMVQVTAVLAVAEAVVDIAVGDITELQVCRTCRTPGDPTTPRSRVTN